MPRKPLTRSRDEMLATIMERVTETSSGCWLYRAKTERAILRWGILRTSVYRLMYELTRGPIPPGMYACHTCDVPRCCNPDHIFIGTAADNIRDAKAKGRMRHGERANGAILTEQQVREIRSAVARGVKGYGLAARYGVNYSTIKAIVRRRIWKHVA